MSPSDHPHAGASSVCDGNCDACPAVFAGDGEAGCQSGPYQGAGLILRCLVVFILPLGLAITGGIVAVCLSAAASREGYVLLGSVSGLAVGIGIALLAGRRWRHRLNHEEVHRA